METNTTPVILSDNNSLAGLLAKAEDAFVEQRLKHATAENDAAPTEARAFLTTEGTIEVGGHYRNTGYSDSDMKTNGWISEVTEQLEVMTQVQFEQACQELESASVRYTLTDLIDQMEVAVMGNADHDGIAVAEECDACYSARRDLLNDCVELLTKDHADGSDYTVGELGILDDCDDYTFFFGKIQCHNSVAAAPVVPLAARTLVRRGNGVYYRQHKLAAATKAKLECGLTVQVDGVVLSKVGRYCKAKLASGFKWSSKTAHYPVAVADDSKQHVLVDTHYDTADTKWYYRSEASAKRALKDARAFAITQGFDAGIYKVLKRGDAFYSNKAGETVTV